MVFNTNQAFKWLSLVWGDYDGQAFVKRDPIKSTALFLWSRFWWLFMVYDFLRYTTLTLFPGHQYDELEFLLCDYGSTIKGKPYRYGPQNYSNCQKFIKSSLWLIKQTNDDGWPPVQRLELKKIHLSNLLSRSYSQSSSLVRTVWCFCVMFLFNRMMGKDKRYRYWLRYFQLPTTRSPDDLQLVGYSKEQLTKFWRLSSSLQAFTLKSLFVQAIVTMSLPSILYGIMMQRHSYRYSPTVFWTILIVSLFSEIAYN